MIPKGQFPSVTEDIPTFDDSGWLLFCGADIPDELAYMTVAAIDEQKADIEELFPEPFWGMTGPVDLKELATSAPIPLHPGAEAYYREHGEL